ncbi:MAG: thymidylate synthase [Gammaproteobacteria bacterium]|nr:thymidylate synthase [Gammaproteobacteria bacterium]
MTELSYLQLLREVIENGAQREDRTGTGTRSIFASQLKFNLRDGFPLLTTKKLHTKSIVHELLWMLSGETNIKYLNDNNVRIWDEWADENGELGRVYGNQWRCWTEYDENTGTPTNYDQIKTVIDSIMYKPDSRRHIVSAWNVSDLDKMALPPCHLLFQFYVENGNLSCHLYQRSADLFLGLPFNIASYALLLSMVAQVTKLKPHNLTISLGDCHIYNNHIDQVRTQLLRLPLAMCELELNPEITNIDDFKYDDINFKGYESWSHIKGEISI